MRAQQPGSVEDCWEEIVLLRIRLRDLQKDVRTLGERLHVIARETEANRPRIIVTRLNGDVE
jgi:hypothetical protein